MTHFQQSLDKESAKCLVVGCRETIQNHKSTRTLSRHLERKHPLEFVILQKQQELLNRKKNLQPKIKKNLNFSPPLEKYYFYLAYTCIDDLLPFSFADSGHATSKLHQWMGENFTGADGATVSS